jgi:hypothetical protein
VTLRPYAVELGFLATAWNQLQQNLSSLFAELLEAKHHHFALAIWHATDSDFTQRKMLHALIVAEEKMSRYQRTLSSVQIEGLLWLLDQIDNKLRFKRNDALHAPLMVVRGVRNDAVRTWVETHFSPLNPRARPLRDKDLIQEFRDYTAHARVLAKYANDVWYALRFPEQRPWPDKPPLPQAYKNKRRVRREPRKPSAPRPSTSQE